MHSHEMSFGRRLRVVDEQTHILIEADGSDAIQRGNILRNFVPQFVELAKALRIGCQFLARLYLDALLAQLLLQSLVRRSIKRPQLQARFPVSPHILIAARLQETDARLHIFPHPAAQVERIIWQYSLYNLIVKRGADALALCIWMHFGIYHEFARMIVIKRLTIMSYADHAPVLFGHQALKPVSRIAMFVPVTHFIFSSGIIGMDSMADDG